MFYVIFKPDSPEDSFMVSDDNGCAICFAKESEALAALKEYSGTSLILRAVARVTEDTIHKVEKIK